MRLHIIAIDKVKAQSPEQTLIQNYAKQCGWQMVFTELQAQKALSGFVRKKAESELLLKHIPNDSKVVVLDEKGKNLSSRDFAQILIDWQDSGVREAVFLIGGAEGHTDEVRQKADKIISFGQMTLPHLLMRVVLCEQLYRAYTISIHHPYHKDKD